MRMSKKCALCEHLIEANGFWQMSDKARLHWGIVHPKEYKRRKVHNIKVRKAISVLEATIKSMYDEEE